MKFPLHIALGALALGLAACNCGLEPNPEGAICDVGGVCPQGYLCVDNVCRGTGSGGGSAGGVSTGGGQGGFGGSGGAGGQGGMGGGATSLCLGVVCNQPPPTTCNGSNLRTFVGRCVEATGLCEYVPMETACPMGCANAQCTGSTCTGVVCNMPPAPVCQGNNLLTYLPVGECRDGMCRYDSTNQSCPGSCANGACVPPAASFTQVLPRVRHEITAVDVRPGSAGDDVLVVGPLGQASRWDGSQWNSLTTGTASNLTAVWYANASSAYITAENGLLRMSLGSVSRVAGFPSLNGPLIDVHGLSEGNFVAVDGVGTVYRFVSATWSKSDGGVGGRTERLYKMNGVYMDNPDGGSPGTAGRIHYYGACGDSMPLGGCVVFSDGRNVFNDKDNQTAGFLSGAPSLNPDDGWFGLSIPAVRRHLPSGTIDSLSVPRSLDGGAVVKMTPVSLGRGTWVLTAPTAGELGYLHRVSGSALSPTVEHYQEALYGYQALSRNDVGGVVMVDMDTATKRSTIVHRGLSRNEALDLGAESWVAGSGLAGASILATLYGDVAIRNPGQSTFQLKRIPYLATATDIALGATVALMTDDDGSVWRVGLGPAGSFTKLNTVPAAGSLNGVCRVSDTEWYLVGKGGGVYRYDGAALTSMTTATGTTLNDVDCPAPGVAVACGQATVMRLANGTWSAVSGAPSGNLTSCAMVGGAIYVAGPNVFARHLNGSWQTLPAAARLDGLLVRSANEAYAANGTSVLRFDGSSWQPAATASASLVTGFFAGTRLVFAGSGGAVMEGQ